MDEPEEKQETKDTDKDKDKEKDKDKKIKKKLLGTPNENSEISEVISVDASEDIGDSKKGTPSKKKSLFNATHHTQ